MENEQLQEMIANYTAETDLQNKLRQGSEIANLYSNKLGQYDEALRYLQEVLQIAEQMQDNSEISIIYNALGELYRQMQEGEKAKQAFLQAAKYGEKGQDGSLLPRPYINLGNIYVEELDITLALDYFERAKNIAERIKNDFLLSIALSSVGRAHLERHDFKNAVKYLRQSLKMITSDTYNRCVIYVNLGIAYGQLKDDSLAIGYFKRAIPMLEKINHKVGIVEMFIRIGEVYESKRNYDMAMQYASLAQGNITENEIADHNVECYLCLLKVRIYVGKELVDEAEEYIQKFLSLGVTNHDYLFAFYDAATGFYAKQKKLDLAAEYAAKYSEMSRIIFKK